MSEELNILTEEEMEKYLDEFNELFAVFDVPDPTARINPKVAEMNKEIIADIRQRQAAQKKRKTQKKQTTSN
jgi:chemotaxis response regulator CheB